MSEGVWDLTLNDAETTALSILVDRALGEGSLEEYKTELEHIKRMIDDENEEIP